MEILFVLTFVFGVLRLITYTKLFTVSLAGIISAFIPQKDGTVISGLSNIINLWFFYFSLLYQTWYWFTYFGLI